MSRKNRNASRQPKFHKLGSRTAYLKQRQLDRALNRLLSPLPTKEPHRSREATLRAEAAAHALEVERGATKVTARTLAEVVAETDERMRAAVEHLAYHYGDDAAKSIALILGLPEVECSKHARWMCPPNCHARIAVEAEALEDPWNAQPPCCDDPDCNCPLPEVSFTISAPRGVR